VRISVYSGRPFRFIPDGHFGFSDSHFGFPDTRFGVAGHSLADGALAPQVT